MKYNLIDIGVNLTGKQFQRDLPQVIERAIAAGVPRMVVTGTSLDGSEQADALSAAYPRTLFATLGVHPHQASELTSKNIERLDRMTGHPGVVAIGECGLDYNRMHSPKKEQLWAFEAQLELAADNDMPVFLHERDAHDDFVALLAQWRHKLPGAVVHCFTGTEDELKAYLDLDCHIGITGWLCDERRGLHLRDLLERYTVDLEDRLMIETDAPWLTPRTVEPRPRRNEPMYLPAICDEVSAWTRWGDHATVKRTRQNAERFFNLPKEINE